MLKVVAAGRRGDVVAGVQKQHVAREGKPFAIGGERDAPALLRQYPDNVTRPFQRPDARQVVALIDFAAILEDGNALAVGCIRNDEL